MSTHVCSNCGHEEAIFGTGGGQKLAADYDVEVIGALPLDLQIRQDTDSGTPSVVADPRSAVANAYLELAKNIEVRNA